MPSKRLPITFRLIRWSGTYEVQDLRLRGRAAVARSRKHSQFMSSGSGTTLTSLPRTARLAQPQHKRAGTVFAAGRAKQPDKGELHEGKLSVLPDEPVHRERCFVAAAVARCQSYPAWRGQA